MVFALLAWHLHLNLLEKFLNGHRRRYKRLLPCSSFDICSSSSVKRVELLLALGLHPPLARERTMAGLAAAWARGRKGGRPGLPAEKVAAI